jgi:hypothetical protein
MLTIVDVNLSATMEEDFCEQGKRTGTAVKFANLAIYALSFAGGSADAHGDVFERSFKTVEHHVDFIVRDDQWWAERDRVVDHRAKHETPLLGGRNDGGADCHFGREGRARCLVGRQFDRADEANAPRFTDEWVSSEAMEAV